MLKLEDLKVGMQLTGLVPGYVARVVSVESAGSDAVTVIVKSELGVAEQQLFRSDEARLAIAEKNLPWSFEAPADDFKLALEAFRIFSKEAQEQSSSGNFFADEDLVVARVDMLSRNEEYRSKLEQVDGDKTEGPYYIRNNWHNELDFGVEHVAFKISDLLTKAEKPEETLI